MRTEQVPRPGECGSGGLVSGGEERQALVNQLLFTHRLTLLVSCLEEQGEQVVALAGCLATLFDHLAQACSDKQSPRTDARVVGVGIVNGSVNGDVSVR